MRCVEHLLPQFKHLRGTLLHCTKAFNYIQSTFLVIVILHKQNNTSPAEETAVLQGGFLKFLKFVHELHVAAKGVTGMKSNMCGHSTVLKAMSSSK